MNDSTLPAFSTPVVQLGVHALPLLSGGMVSGGLYALLAEIPSARFPILAGSMASAIEGGIKCSVILPNNPELFLQRINSFGELDAQESMAADCLQLFLMQDEFAKKMFRFGAENFTQELEYFDIPEHSFLLFDQADELLSLHDISLALDQIEVLSKWLAKRDVTALLVFTRLTPEHANTINAMMDNLTGIARLGGEKNGLEISFDYWQSPEGAVAARRFPLQALASGLYEVAPVVAAASSGQRSTDPISNVIPDDTELRVFYMDPDLGSLARQSAGVWQPVDTLVGMLHATRASRSATIILSFQSETRLRELAETVHTLRLGLGRNAHIVVQEKSASLRFQNEALLLRLGVNLIIHRDVPSSRLTLLLDSLRGQIFNRDVDINFEAALASVTPTRMRGYLRPLRFVREVDLILDRAVTLNIPCALIVAIPHPGQPLAEVLHRISLSRPGDLTSADHDQIYIFFNACQQSVLLSTLERILGASVDSVFSNIRFLVRREDIQPELAALSRALDAGSLPDHSAAFGDANPEDASSIGTMPERTTQPVAFGSAPTTRATPGRGQAEAVPKPKLSLFSNQGLRPAPSQPSTPPAAQAATSSTPRSAAPFVYTEEARPSVFGKQQAPRAVRSTQSKS